ncbi:MAG: hypothetical protein ACWGQW_20600 [bacterium]
MSSLIEESPSENGEWVSAALGQLIYRQNADAGWGYRVGGQSSSEPTALACLALLAHCPNHEILAIEDVILAAGWLTRLQQPDGALGISKSRPEPRWPTAYGLLTWTNLPGFRSPADKAREWLLGQKGEKGSHTDLVDHNPELQGWPWLSGTHSWLEPTAVSVLALRRAGLTSHSRTQDGIQLILDRAIASGGWNYGNRRVFGQDLRPQPATTGLALLALAQLDDRPEEIDPAISYLSRALETVRAPMSLCWGLLGLTAWNRRPAKAAMLLRTGFERIQELPTSNLELAYLLLGAEHEAWRMLVSPKGLED